MRTVFFKCICVLTLALSFASCGKRNETDTGAEAAAVTDVIMSRRSVRSYTSRPVVRETLDKILECGIHAPNAMNAQSWEIRVVDNQDLLARMDARAKEADPERSRPLFFGAPAVVFIANDTAQKFSPVDCGLAGENIMVSAWSMGVASCFLGSSAMFFNTPAAAEFRETLGFSPGYEILGCIALGYSDDVPKNVPPRAREKVRYID